MAEAKLADYEGSALVGVSVLERLEQLEPVSDPCHCNLANLQSVECLDQGDHCLQREEAQSLLLHGQRVIDGNQDLVVSLGWHRTTKPYLVVTVVRGYEGDHLLHVQPLACTVVTL